MSHISFFPYRWSPLASCKIVQLQCCTIVSLLAIYYKHTLNESCMPYTADYFYKPPKYARHTRSEALCC